MNAHDQKAPFSFSGSLAKTVLNSLSANIAIIDQKGIILHTNRAWRNYAKANGMDGDLDSIGVNYLSLCAVNPYILPVISAAGAARAHGLTCTARYYPAAA